jgi:hypothetical protein
MSVHSLFSIDPSYCMGLDIGRRIMSDAGVLVCTCEECGVVRHVDVSNSHILPPCDKCGPVMWTFDKYAMELLRGNGFIG